MLRPGQNAADPGDAGYRTTILDARRPSRGGDNPQITVTTPTVSSATATPATANLGVGRVVTLTVGLSAPVTVSGGTPALLLNDGGIATYTGGSGTNALTFSYTVLADQDTPDLAVTGTALNGATILDAASNAADLAGAVTNPSGTLKITGTAPTVSSVTLSPDAGDIGVGQTATFLVVLSALVTVSGGTPTLLLNDGGVATYVGGTGSTELVFNYTVAAGQNTANLTVTGSALNGATVLDAAGNAANLAGVTAPAGTLQITGTVPTVSSVTASPATADLGFGKQVTLTVGLTAPVTVSGGTPTLLLNDGGTATYTSGSGTSTLTFVYTVAAGQNTPDLTVTGSALNGATILDAAGNAADLIGAVGNPVGTLQITGTVPTVSSVTASPATADLGVGKQVTLTVGLTAPVTVSGGTPTLLLNDGGKASYTGGSGTNTLTFAYTVAAGQNTADLAVTGSALNGAKILDAAGNAANLAGAVTNPAGTLQIDTTAPTISTVVASPATADVGVGALVTLTVGLSAPVTVSGGKPTLQLNDGGTATYTGGSGTNALTFAYTVLAGQNTPDLAVTGSALNGATIIDGAGNVANLAGVAANPAGTLQITGTAPIVSSVTLSPDSGDLGAGQKVTFIVVLSAAVTVSDGTPVLLLNDGGTANYVGGSGSTVLVFNYTVAAGQDTTNLTAIGSALNGATVLDAAGNPANLAGVATNPSGTLQITGTAPTVSTVTASPATADIGIGELVTLTLGLTAAVTVSGGTPALLLNDGGIATYASGSGTNALTFAYTVLAGQNTSDLAVTGTTLNGATIADAEGNLADLTKAVTNPSGTLRITGTAPTVSAVTAATDLGIGQVVTFTVGLSAPVTVSGGTPTLLLNDGGMATYASGSGTSVLSFTYTVATQQNTADLAVTGSALNGAAILDGAGNLVDLPGAASPTLSTVTASPATANLGTGQLITLTVDLSAPVTVSGGTPTLLLNDGGTAAYAGGSGTSTLTFADTLAAGQNTADLAVIGSALNGATILDAAGNQADLTGAVTDPVTTIQITGTPPTVTSVAATAATGDLGVGQVATLTVALSAPVTVSGGTPTLLLNDGGTATYTAGSGTNTLTFAYTVAAGQNTPDLTVTGSALNGATILDAAGNAADLTGAVANPAGTLQVDTTAPTVTTVTASPNTADLGVGGIVTFTLGLSAPVTISGGRPALLLNDGGTATYTRGSGTSTLTFTYTVAAGQNTADLMVTGSALNGASIQDAAGNAADLTAVVTNLAGTLQIDTTAGTAFLPAPHGQYIVADDNGSLYIQNTAASGGSQVLPSDNVMVFTDGVGVFDPTGNAEDVARLYLAALGREPDLAGLQYWTAQVNDGKVSLSAVASAFAASPEFIQDYGSLTNAAFVNQLYHNVLGRAADAAGADYWDGTLASGASRGSVLLDFAESPEFKANTLATAGDTDDAEAYRLYQAAFERAPDPVGQAYWTAALATGATPTQIAQEFINSAEFQESYGAQSPGEFVAAMYQNVLHRAADPSGLQYWTSTLQRGTAEASVLVSFADSLENRAQTAAATHANWVFIPS